ncbi:uncharacterized protein BDR25DRAFT_23779 [Lindgomyces ingoldianus]|uniref:Uncharacterized protein n=1 Tax=Lindgomyces ingoldianus TaxID=673940 RepID=A0ACB6QY89_9PLEO|nr:uncharacterized protein BDR25DRAFT_23779 [Lindgomyces ingoldianus]KAF2471851.1 hypothetical protein BDR25DRAFT_23779 [Lindgomyces ingoldianus]
MNSSTRLYGRLEQIPQDPSDPESLEELVVCAFGAFERYYVCWRNRGGEYRQDGYDLPPALHEWLFPTDGSFRDFPSLQVVFGRGDEYFASDKNGKLENKETEIKKPQPRAESPEKVDKPILRRSRTISFIRPPPDPIMKPFSPATDTPPIREVLSRPPSVAIHSQPSSRPSSTSSITSAPQPSSRPPSMILGSQPSSQSPSLASIRAVSDSAPKSYGPVTDTPIRDSPTMSPMPVVPRQTTIRPLSMSFNPGAFPRILEEDKSLPDSSILRKRDSGHCTCGCHIASPPAPARPIYADASVQTDPEPKRRPEPLRVDTASDTSSLSSRSNRSSVYDIETPMTEALPAPNPVVMGGMLSYFNNPGYRLGDSLRSTYYSYQLQPVGEQDGYGLQEKWNSAVMGRRQTV